MNARREALRRALADALAAGVSREQVTDAVRAHRYERVPPDALGRELRAYLGADDFGPAEGLHRLEAGRQSGSASVAASGVEVAAGAGEPGGESGEGER